MWIYINNLDQVIWLAENLKWARHLNLFSRTRVKCLASWPNFSTLKITAPDYKLSPTRSTDIFFFFFLFCHENMLWVSIKQDNFNKYPQHELCFCEKLEKKKKSSRYCSNRSYRSFCSQIKRFNLKGWTPYICDLSSSYSETGPAYIFTICFYNSTTEQQYNHFQR